MGEVGQFKKIQIGISSCLLGESVRHNGGHKHFQYCTEVLSEFFEFQGFCPEVGIGMGVPRESIRLVGELESPRAVGSKDDSFEVTSALIDFGQKLVPQVAGLGGYIWMKDSPSCGLYSAKIYPRPNMAPGKTSGLVAGLVSTQLPLIPMEENGRLNDPALRENFIARVFAYREWQQVADKLTPANLVAFHSRHKYWVMSFSQALYRELGRMVASAGSSPLEALAQAYIGSLIKGSRKPPTRKGHVNVLYHILGYLKEVVPGGIRQDLVEAIEEYRTCQVPLAVPIKIIKHYVDNFASDYVKSQTYLNPYPYSLGLRNEI